jgi:hypothetical protein
VATQRRDQYGAARLDLSFLAVDDHRSTAAHDHVDLLAIAVGVDILLTSRLTSDPGHGDVPGAELGREEKMRDLPAAHVHRAIVKRADIHNP